MMIKVDAEHRAYVAQRAVGSGFHSVLFADVRSAEEAAECVRWVRADHPDEGGTYGVGMRRFTFMGYGGTPDYVQALRDIVVVIMIEKQSAVDQLEEILAVDGVDMIQWGSADYSMNIGRPGERTIPEVLEVQEFIFRKSLEKRVPPRVELNALDGSQQPFLDMGVRHFCIGWDRFISQPADALGGFLEGAFAPLAFLWLVVGFFLQQRQLMEKDIPAIARLLGHNDLLPGNFIDDGDRLWLVDWDYAGFNCPLFDLANLASNSELSEDQERWLLETYFEVPADDLLWRRYSAMKCASLLREGMWSMISELHSTVDFDYVAYTAENMARFERAYAAFEAL